MIELNSSRLRELARSDSAVAPLARLQAEALDAAAELSREDQVPMFEERPASGLPLLHARTIPLDVEVTARLLDHLAATCADADGLKIKTLRVALNEPGFDLLQLLHAAIVQDCDRLRDQARRIEMDAGLLRVLADLSLFPLMQACGRAAMPLLKEVTWDHGFCPVCAAWPTLAEMRGLERRRWLRCGRCGTGWGAEHQRCTFCGTSDHRALAYLAAEAERESRRAETCERCRGYLKTLASLGPFDTAELFIQDLQTIELDVAALEQGYTHPDRPGFDLQVRLEPLSPTGWAR